MRGETDELDLVKMGQELGLRKKPTKKKRKRKSYKGMLKGFVKGEDCQLAMIIYQMNEYEHKNITCPFRNAPKETRCERPDKGKYTQCGGDKK